MSGTRSNITPSLIPLMEYRFPSLLIQGKYSKIEIIGSFRADVFPVSDAFFFKKQPVSFCCRPITLAFGHRVKI